MARGAPGNPRGLVAAAMTVSLAALAWGVTSWGRLPALDPDAFISGYGVTDNRRLLLRYGGLVLAALAGPILAWGVERTRGRRAPIRTADPGSGRISRWTLFGVPVILGFLFLGRGTTYAPLNGHELVHLGYVNEIEHGRLLNIDTRVTYGPLLGYSLWAFMKLTTFDLVGFRFYWTVAALVGVIAVWILAGRFLSNRSLGWLLLGYLMLHTVARLFLPDGHGTNGGLWGWGNFLRHGWAVLLVLGFARPLARSRAGWLRALAGGTVSLGILYAQETASGGLAALGFLLLSTGLRGSLRDFVRDLGWAASGAVVILGLAMLPAMWRGALASHLDATLEIPRSFLTGGGNQPYPSLLGEDRHGHAAWAGYYLLPAFSLTVLAWAGWRTWTGRAEAVLLPLAAYTSLSFVTVLVRADGLHLLNVAAAPIVLGFLLLDRLQTRIRSAGGRAGRAVLPGMLALPLFLWSPGWTTLVGGLAGRIAHPLPAPPEGWERIPGERGGVWTPRGDWFDSPTWGGVDDPETPDFIRSVSGDSPVYIRGNKASLYYFLADVACAASFTDLSSQCLTPQAYRLLFRELAERPPETVLLMESTIGPRPREGYRYFGTHHGLEVFRRADLSPLSLEAPPSGSP